MDLNSVESEQRRISVESKQRRIARFNPLEVMREILLRLSVANLLRFRPVCKLWHSIILDPHFIQSHLDRSLNTRLLSIIFAPNCNGEDALHIVRLDANKLKSSVTQPYFSKVGKTPNSKVTGSCNGLLCIVGANGENVKVLNPSTGESLTPPMHTLSNPSYVNPAVVFLGFHPSTKEYKLINFFADRGLERADGMPVGCEVYTLGTNSWRKLTTRFAYNPDGRVLVSAKGFMLWNINTKTDEVSLLRFDLKEEVFSLIPPLQLEQIYQQRQTLCGSPVELQHNIYLPVFPFDPSSWTDQMDMWVLNDDEHSWTLKFSLFHPWGYCLKGAPLPTPLLMRNGNILVHAVEAHIRSVTYLQYHHPIHPRRRLEYRSFRSICDNYEEVKVFDNFANFCPLVHVESLVPLFEQPKI